MEIPEPTHLSTKARQALLLPLEERVLYALEDRWFGYPAAKEALAKMAMLLARPRTTNMPCLLLLGRSGNGKSMIMQRFQEKHPATVRSDGGATGGFILFEQSAGAKETVFWSDILYACGTAHRDTDPALRKRTQAISVVEGLQARGLGIDELHNIGHGSPLEQRHLLAVIKTLTNTMKAPIIAAGTETAERLIEDDDQLKRRFRTVVLPKWQHDDGFLQLCASFEKVLPLAKPSGLDRDEISARLYDMSLGTIGEVAEILKQAAVLAIRSGQEFIDLAILDQVPLNTPEARKRRSGRM